jgi:hypothetical protein
LNPSELNWFYFNSILEKQEKFRRKIQSFRGRSMKRSHRWLLQGVATIATLTTTAPASFAAATDSFRVEGTRIFKNGDTSKGWIARGLNMMNQFDRKSSQIGSHGFNANIVRECVFDLKDITFGTGTTQAWNPDSNSNVTLHGLRNLVNDNRGSSTTTSDDKVTILVPFSYEDFDRVTGKNPYDMWYFTDGSYNNRLAAMADAFKNDGDVWISTWNEPYGDDWTNTSWYHDQLSMIRAIRNTGNNNPIVVCGTLFANSMQEFLDNGQYLLNAAPNTTDGRGKNIIFDWHAYKYMEWYDQATIEARIQEVKDKNLCMIMGEYGPETGWWNGAPIHINPTAVQNAVVNKKIGGLAWYLKPGNDGNCLVWDNWTAKNDVYNWYNTVKSFLNTMSNVVDSTGSTPTNLVSNPGFEASAATQTPSGWTEQSWAGGVDAFYSESGGRSGSYRGTFWRSTAYNLYLSQYKTGLANGLYTLRCYTRSGGGFKTLYLEAKDFGGTAKTANVPTSTSAWTKVEITGINVTNGTCRIGIWGDANAGNWAHFDDFEFIKQ